MRPPRSRVAAVWSYPLAFVCSLLLALTSPALAKDRVAKPKSPPPSTPTPAAPQTPTSDTSDAEDFGACVGGCFSFLDGLFGDDEPAAAAPSHLAVSRADALVPGGGAWNVHDRAWLRGAAGDSVVLWSDPYSRDHPDVEAARLPVGTPVTILERHEMSDRLELRVVRADDIDPVGWVPSTALAASAAEATIAKAPPADIAATQPAAADKHGLWWGVRLAPGADWLLSGDLAGEYDIGFHADVGYSREVARSLPLGVTLGFWSNKGQPEFNYRTATGFDTPENSTFRLASLAVDFGVRFAARPKGPVFFLTLGPALYYVHEDADVQTTIIVITPPDTTAVPGPSRSENLDRWAGGGMVRTGLGWCPSETTELGLQFAFNALAWDGHREKSLTTDYTHNGLYVFDVSLEFTFGGYR